MADESIIVDLKTQGVKDLVDSLGLASKGFTELDKSIAEAQKKLDGLDKNSQEFKNLTKEISAATTAAQAYSQNTDTLKKELRDTTNEIGNLERSIKALEKTNQTSSQTYVDLVKKQDDLKRKAGELKDTVSDLNAEIKNSGSDTKNLDKALRAINSVAAGYQVAQGAVVLFGGENKKFEQTLLKLNAVIAITNGLQQIQNELSKKDSLFTALAARAKLAYASATASASVAMNAFRLAMVSLGIGAFVVAVGYLVANWDRLKVSIFGVTQTLDDYIKSKEKSLAISQKALDLLDKELEYQIAIGAITEQRAKEIKTEAIGKQLKQESEVLKGQLKIYEDLKKKRQEQGITSGFFITALVKSAFKVSNAEIESQKNAVLGQTQIVKDLTVKYLASQKEKDEKIKQENKKNIKDLTEDIIKAQKEIREAEARHQKQLEELDRQERERMISNAELRKKLSDERIALLEMQDERERELRLKNVDFKEQNAERERKAADERAKAERDRIKRESDEFRQAQLDKIAAAAFVGNELFSIADGISNARKQILDNELASGIISEKKYQEELRKIKRQEAIANKAQAAFNISISIAEAIVKALTAGPLFGQVLAGITAALGFAQLAVVLATPIPKFRQGGQVSEKLGLIKGKRHEQGGVPIEVEGDEYVMPVKETRENLDALKAIHKGKFKELYIPKSQLIQPDIFANIPNPATIEIPNLMDKDDYSSINERLDKVASELWWLTNETKKGNKLRERGTEKVVKAVQSKSKRYV